MKRVDFDPNGERNPQNRGKSRYERISWDEAATLVANEIKRVQETYGGSAISGMTSSHHNWGIVGYKMGPFRASLTWWREPRSWTTPTAGKAGTGGDA